MGDHCKYVRPTQLLQGKSIDLGCILWPRTTTLVYLVELQKMWEIDAYQQRSWSLFSKETCGEIYEGFLSV